MNIHNFKDQSNKGKALLLLTYPLAIGVHYMEWHRMRKLQRMIRKWISAACKNPNGQTQPQMNVPSRPPTTT